MALPIFDDIDTADVYDITEDTADLDFQHQFSPLAGHTAQWGVALRHVRTRMRTDPQTISFARKRRADTLASAFVQDEISFCGRPLVVDPGQQIRA